MGNFLCQLPFTICPFILADFDNLAAVIGEYHRTLEP